MQPGNESANLGAARSISMLSPETLEALAAFARESVGGILEIGAYVGGSTLALAIGNAGRQRHAVIETGGAHPTHPVIPSTDILRDWRANMERFGLADGILLAPGWSFTPGLMDGVGEYLQSIGIVFIDADDSVARDVRLAAPFMAADATLILDDYSSDGASDKARAVRAWVDHHLREGRLLEYGIRGGAWFGRFASDEARCHFAQAPAFGLERGNAWIAFIKEAGQSDTIQTRQSTLKLYENGIEIGPAHSLHDDIRILGAGRFSHWSPPLGAGDALVFSASDNSDPNVNGYRYDIDVGRGPEPIDRFLQGRGERLVGL